jgi:hypothetical protein
LAAQAAGLTDVRALSSFFTPTGVEGRLGPLTISMVMTGERNSSSSWEVAVSGIALELTVRAEGVGARIQKRLGIGDDVETGDAAFDGDLIVLGDPGIAHALLDAKTRETLRRRFDSVVSLWGGRLVVRVPALYTVADALKAALDLARPLVLPDDLATRLAHNALEDPVEGVRLACLRTLILRHAQHPATRGTLEHACEDTSERVRLEAALARHDEGHDALRRLAREAKDEACAARALRALQAALDPTEGMNLLEAALDRARPAVAAICIDVLGRREPELLPAGFEPLLIRRALWQSDEVRAAAAVALGKMGTVAAVLPLQETAQKASGSLRRTIDDAVHAIQARLSGAERGQLTVSQAEGGTVTLAAGGGEVSLPDPDRSRAK